MTHPALKGQKSLNTLCKLFYLVVNKYTYLGIFLDDLHKKVCLSDFEKRFSRPHQTIKAHLEEFVGAHVLRVEKRARFGFYSLNLGNPMVLEYLSLCAKERLIMFLNRPLFKRVYEVLAPFTGSIAVFGSSVDSEDFSDIDLLVLSKVPAIRKALDRFKATYSVRLHVVQTECRHLAASFIKELKGRHIFLNNHDEFIRELYGHELGLV